MAKAATTRKKPATKKTTQSTVHGTSVRADLVTETGAKVETETGTAKTAGSDDKALTSKALASTDKADGLTVSTDNGAVDQNAEVAAQKRQAINDLFQRGLAAHQAGQVDDAVRLYSAALRQNPQQPDVWNNLGVALRRSKKFDAALIAYRRAADLRPENAGLWSNMGNCLREMMRFDEALIAHKKALELDDTIKSHTFNAGLVYRDMNRFDTALEYFERALTVDPDYVDANWDKSLANLAIGNYAKGWAGYETRRKLADNPIRQLDSAPEWDGKASLRGKRILLRAEQGFGDMIQFARFVPLVARKAGHVILECRKELIPIMRTVSGVGTVVEKGRPLPEFDLHVPLLSLPHVMGLGEKDLQKISTASYLSPPDGKTARLAPPPGTVLKVGLVWAGKLNPRDRSCPLETLLPILSAKGAAFYSFQIDDRRSDIDKLGLHAFVTDLGDHIHDFGDSAALMQEMDLVVSIDSSPAHLAGALGVPVWMLQLYTTDWRWMVERSDSPWYPTMRIYRQESPGDWSTPVKKLGNDFSTLLQARQRTALAVKERPSHYNATLL